jgi:hypothetical protein
VPAAAGGFVLTGRQYVYQLSVGSTASHTCARVFNGSVLCWGLNDEGQLGYGHTNNIGDDESVSSAGFIAGGMGFLSVSVGLSHTCGLCNSTDGNVFVK